MATTSTGTDFISFIVDAEGDDQLATAFFKPKTAADLLKFFKTKGYTAIQKRDCEEILTIRNGLKGVRFNGPGGAPFDCGGAGRGY